MRQKFILGAHTLSSMFTVKSSFALRRVMQTTVNRGGTILEMPYLLNTLPWQEVAVMARETGIKEINLCHFFPYKGNTPIAGDPLGDKLDVKKAQTTLSEAAKATRILRNEGVSSHFFDGPTWGGLGRHYRLSQKALDKRVVSFLKSAGDICGAAKLTLAVEFLRLREDKVIGGTKRMLGILEKVNHPRVKMHFDVYHSLDWNENPAESIYLAGSWIAYLHLHGTLRAAPGAWNDRCNWTAIIAAVNEINSGIHGIPVVPEPFGKATIKENPTLGEGLPIPPPLGEYLTIAYRTLRFAGLKA